jgi:hypothetical protein
VVAAKFFSHSRQSRRSNSAALFFEGGVDSKDKGRHFFAEFGGFFTANINRTDHANLAI